MASTKKDTSTSPKCTCCGGKLDSYVSKSELFKVTGYLPYCKECVDSEYEKLLKRFNFNVDKAIYNLCMKLDMPFYFNTLNGAKQESEKSNGKLNRIYITKINSFRDKNGYGDSFLDGEQLSSSSFQENDDSEIEDELVQYWGKNKKFWEYEFLENEMYRLKADFECTDYGMEMIMKDICFINLDIERIRQGLDKGDVTKLIESRSKLMNDGNLKPVQSTGADKNEKLSLGVFIKKWENERPVTRTLDDEMKKYIDTYMVGHLAKMEGLNNEIVKQYNEAIKEYTINFSEISPEEDEE